MAQPFISLIKFRRGDTASLNEAIESNVVFEEGEPIYITDSRRMLIGSGEATNNLTVVGNKLYESEPTTAYTGDLLYEDNFLSYYDGEDWNKILPAVDGTTVTYTEDNKLKALSFNAGNGININNREISIKKSNQFTFNEESKLIIASEAINKSNLKLTNIFDTTNFNISTEQVSIRHDNTLSIAETGGLTINQIPEDIFKSSLDSQLDLRSFTHDEYEKITITDTIKYRKGMSMEERVEANNKMNETLGKINVLAEAYPELKASENFKTLQTAIADVEEHLQAARRLYNANISSYNQRVVSFPSSMIASFKGLSKREFFEADEAKKEDVKIEF